MGDKKILPQTKESGRNQHVQGAYLPLPNMPTSRPELTKEHVLHTCRTAATGAQRLSLQEGV